MKKIAKIIWLSCLFAFITSSGYAFHKINDVKEYRNTHCRNSEWVKFESRVHRDRQDGDHIYGFDQDELGRIRHVSKVIIKAKNDDQGSDFVGLKKINARFGNGDTFDYGFSTTNVFSNAEGFLIDFGGQRNVSYLEILASNRYRRLDKLVIWVCTAWED